MSSHSGAAGHAAVSTNIWETEKKEETLAVLIQHPILSDEQESKAWMRLMIFKVMSTVAIFVK